MITRTCPACQKLALRPVAGGRGKMGRCPACGWTGPMTLDNTPTRTPWSGMRELPPGTAKDDDVDILAAIVARNAVKGKRGN